MCRFSPFVKTGTEGYILGSTIVKRNIRPEETVKVVVSFNVATINHVPPTFNMKESIFYLNLWIITSSLVFNERWSVVFFSLTPSLKN